MRWVWLILTILLAVSGAIGGYNTIEAMLRGDVGLRRFAALLLAVFFVFLATKTYTRARAA